MASQGQELGSAKAFLAGGGALGAIIAAFDWSKTPLGPIENWPTSLKTAVGLILRSPIAIVALWGEQGTMIYNDAYSVFAGNRHPALLGSKVREGWPEVADFNDNIVKTVYGRGETISYRDHELVLYRRGSENPESVWLNLDYSPVLGEDGKPIGVIAIVVEITETHYASIRVRESEERLRALANASSDVIYQLSADWREIRQLAGRDFLTPVESPTRDWIDVYLFPEDVPAVQNAIDEAIRSKSIFELEHRVRRADGSAGWTFSRAIPILDRDGGIIEWFGTASDISGRKEVEARLRFLDTLGKETSTAADADSILGITTRMTGQHLGAAICAYADMDDDQDGFTIRGDWTRQGSQHILGHYSLAAFGKRAVTELRAGRPLVINDNLKELPPEEAATFQAIGVGSTICMPLVKEGRLTALMAVHDRGPHVWTASEIAMLSEVTERSWAHIERVRAEAETRSAEQEFRRKLALEVADRTADFEQSEKNLRTVFETSFMHQGLLTVDGMIVYVNATALVAVDRKLEDVVGMDFSESPWFEKTPGMSERVHDSIVRAAAGEHVQMPISLDLPGGRRFYEFSMRPAYDEASNVVALVPEAVEVTARVRAEEALQQAIKLEAIGNLTGGIAHDFNNLLMAVLGSLELLRRRMPADPALMRLVDNASEGARRGKSLTERMLAFARKQDLKPERVDLSELIGGMADLMARALGPTISVHIETDDSLPPVESDPNQLEAAILNLAVNARDAMNGEGPIVIASRHGDGSELPERLKPGAYVVLTMSDAGGGMDDATLRRATEPFFTTKGVGKGTGLGLSMVHGLTEQSGGALVLKSTVGVGTIAEIWLPAIAEAARPVIEARAAAGLPAPMEMSSQLRILAVDDDPLVLMNTVEMLEDLGHAVVSVTSARQALEQVKTTTFDMVITDHAMPHVTGAQLIKELRVQWPQMPVILATGYAELPPGAEVDVLRLRKPYSQAELAEAVARTRYSAAAH